jgi:hypothetical protein
MRNFVSTNKNKDVTKLSINKFSYWETENKNDTWSYSSIYIIRWIFFWMHVRMMRSTSDELFGLLGIVIDAKGEG